MGLRCPILSDEYIGADSGSLCRKSVAKRKGFVCPRCEDPWVVHQSCFDMTRLTKKTRAETEEMFRPKSMAIAGDGLPDARPETRPDPVPGPAPVIETVHAKIVETNQPLQDSL